MVNYKVKFILILVILLSFVFNLSFVQASLDINFTNPSPFSGEIVYGDLLINITFSNADNATVYLFNSTKGQINSSFSTTSSYTANFSNLSSGVYYFNATATNSSSDMNSTLTRNIVLVNSNLTGDGSVKSSYKINESRFGNGNELSGDALGVRIENIGDLNGDGVIDIAVGEPENDDGGANNGAIWIFFLNTSGGVIDEYKINESRFGNGTELGGDKFGYSIANLGDLNGDGIQDIAVGAIEDQDGGADTGSVWILFLNTTGGVTSEYKINESRFGNGNELGTEVGFGWDLDGIGDLDNDGIQDLVVGEIFSNDGGANNGAIWILFLNKSGGVKDVFEINNTIMELSDTNSFGSSVENLGDLNNDGIIDLAVGERSSNEGGDSNGLVWILFLNNTWGIKSKYKINESRFGNGTEIEEIDLFGSSVANLGDLNNDDIIDIAVGMEIDNGFSSDIWILFLNTSGGVIDDYKINESRFGNGNELSGNLFGVGVEGIGDLNGDGIVDLATSEVDSSDGGANNGAIWMLFLDSVVSCSDFTNQTWNATWNTGGSENAWGIEVDNNCNVYIAGSNGSGITVIKYNQTGGNVWNASYDPGNAYDNTAITLDNSTNIYVTGHIEGGTTSETIKFNSSGGEIWNTSLSPVTLRQIAVDSQQNVYAGGVYGGPTYSFVVKYNSSGSQVWNTSGTTTTEEINDYDGAMTKDSDDNIYIALCEEDFFELIKYNSTGSKIWNITNHTLPVDESFYCDGMNTDSKNDIYITGSGTAGGIDRAGLYNNSNGDLIFSWDLFGEIDKDDSNNVYTIGATSDYLIRKYNSLGTHLSNVTYDSGGSDSGNAITLDNLNNVYVTGLFNNDVFTLKVGLMTGDTTSPDINITSPSENGTSSTDNGLDIEFTVSDDIGLDSCWYSNDSYSVNRSTGCGINLTNLTWSLGEHNLTIYVNDSAGNLNFSSISFTISEAGGGDGGGGGGGGGGGSTTTTKKNETEEQEEEKEEETEEEIEEEEEEEGEEIEEEFVCGEWSECNAVYGLDDLSDEEISLRGEKVRICSNGEIEEIQRSGCSVAKEIEVIKKGEGEVEIFGEEGEIVAGLKLFEEKGVEKLDLVLFFEEIFSEGSSEGSGENGEGEVEESEDEGGDEVSSDFEEEGIGGEVKDEEGFLSKMINYPIYFNRVGNGLIFPIAFF